MSVINGMMLFWEVSSSVTPCACFVISVIIVRFIGYSIKPPCCCCDGVRKQCVIYCMRLGPKPGSDNYNPDSNCEALL